MSGSSHRLPPYRSPARLPGWRSLEEKWLAPGPLPGRNPLYVRVRARVPQVLYLNFLARYDYAARLAPDFFHPAPLESDPSKTLFTVLLFELVGGRPVWLPEVFGRLAPAFVQANCRFYGRLMNLAEGPRPGVFFWRTVTDSLLLAAFGRRWARCFPLLRAGRMKFERKGADILAGAEPGRGSAPGLFFRGRLRERSEVPPLLREQFSRFSDYTRWIMDQHLSATAWEREVVVQDMHLGLEAARVRAVEPLETEVTALEEFVERPGRPLSCFLAENLEVWLDSIRAVPRTGG